MYKMKSDKVIIKKSQIHGRGIFAGKNFRKGETVLHWNASKIIPSKQFEKMTEKEKSYITFCDGKYIKMQSPESFMNRSCQANTKIEAFCDIATRDIAKGEEITSKYKISEKCNCEICKD